MDAEKTSARVWNPHTAKAWVAVGLGVFLGFAMAVSIRKRRQASSPDSPGNPSAHGPDFVQAARVVAERRSVIYRDRLVADEDAEKLWNLGRKLVS